VAEMKTSAPGPLILSIDDDPRIRKLIDLHLVKEGYRVVSAPSGDEGLKALASFWPDLILLDVMMPGMNGYEVCARLQEKPETAEIPVIFVTSLGEVRDKAKAFAAGAVDHLVKPFSREDLVAKVRVHLEMADRRREITGRKGGGQEGGGHDFRAFREFLLGRIGDDPRRRAASGKLAPATLYSAGAEMGLPAAAVAQAVAEFIRAPYLPSLNPKDIRLGVLSTRFCRSNRVVPLNDATVDVSFAVSNPFDLAVQDTLSGFADQGRSVRIMLTEPENVDLLLRGLEGEASLEELAAKVSMEAQARSGEEIEEFSFQQEEAAPVDDLQRSAGEAPVIQLANELVAKAIHWGASDLHIEPREIAVGIRYRIDGMLVEKEPLPKRIGPSVISRFKIMASMDIANRRTPQDGRIRVTARGHKVDMRVSTLPCRHGEKMVIRFQDMSATSLDFESLGFEGTALETLRACIRKPHGILLVTGPTGSGKTTTLYTALQALNDPGRNIVTVEDPVEFELHRITQVQIRPEAGLTFPVALRAILRQDPNVIMVGEMRDAETADIAIKAALTGHLVLSTLHTNDAPSAVLRLVDMGVPAFLVASAVQMVLAQRLLRKLCPHCRTPSDPPPNFREKFKIRTDAKAQFYRAVGCDRCNQIGYKGRIGAAEILVLDDALRALIQKAAGTDEIRAQAVKNGMVTLQQDAVLKAVAGSTSPEEVLRVTG
jgi:type II secretory ATPase GspE/PulE/Tfp pilus assembly ATPase PilB-like protein/DNA-binding response OmpR family regulator